VDDQDDESRLQQ